MGDPIVYFIFIVYAKADVWAIIKMHYHSIQKEKLTLQYALNLAANPSNTAHEV